MVVDKMLISVLDSRNPWKMPLKLGSPGAGCPC